MLMAEHIIRDFGEDLSGLTIGLWGLAFKPETDDIREAPALDIASELIKRGATVRAYDPAAMEASQKVLPELICCEDAYDALTGADVMTIVTEWNEFRMLDLTRAKKLMAAPRMVDMRNIYDGASMAAAGFEYKGVGV